MKRLLFTIICILALIGSACAESGWQGDQASDIKTDTLYFDNNLSILDDNVQKALDTLDNFTESDPLSFLTLGRTGGQTAYGGIAQTEGLTLIGNYATASGTNIAGGDVSIKARPGTGTGVSSLHFFTGTTLESGSTLQTSTEKMTILGSGNVGIGTTSPGRVLHVKGDSSANNAQIKIEGSGDISKMYLGMFSGGGYLSAGGTYSSGWSADGTNAIANITMQASDANSFIDFSTSSTNGAAPTSQVRIDNNGNVGIGTTNPLAKLQVENAGVVAININDNSSTQIPTINFQQGGTTKAFIEGGVDLSSRMDLGAGGNRIMTLINGKVGIGTTAPIRKLTSFVNGEQLALQYDANNFASFYSKSNSDLQIYTYNGSGYGNIILGMDGTTQAGNVGIGTTSPTAVLHLKAGTATQYTAPLKLTTGVLNTTAEAGAVEFLTDAYYGTTTTNAVRRMIVMGKTGRAAAQTAANASVATYTLGATDASYEVSANVLVTTSSAEAFTVTCAYTDEGNTARTLTFNFQLLAGTIGTAINFANGAVPYEGIPLHIRCKASTAITIATTGVFTGATYNVEGIIKQTA